MIYKVVNDVQNANNIVVSRMLCKQCVQDNMYVFFYCRWDGWDGAEKVNVFFYENLCIRMVFGVLLLVYSMYMYLANRTIIPPMAIM